MSEDMKKIELSRYFLLDDWRGVGPRGVSLLLLFSIEVMEYYIDRNVPHQSKRPASHTRYIQGMPCSTEIVASVEKLCCSYFYNIYGINQALATP